MRTLSTVATLVLACAGTLAAQPATPSIAMAPSDPMNVAITARGGVTLATPRGAFPSLIIGDSRRSTGSIDGRYGTAETGHSIDVAALIPFMPDLGVSVAFGSQRLAVSFPADSLRLATRFDLQRLVGSLGVQWSALHLLRSYEWGGLRSVYLDAGFDIGLVTTGNRVEGTAYDDTLGGERRAASGTIQSGDAFRTSIALRGGIGLRFAATPNIEVVLEGSYAHGLNAVFSSEAIEGNDFALDVTRAVLGVGYRF